jgi:SUN domain-containing protein 1/2
VLPLISTDSSTNSEVGSIAVGRFTYDTSPNAGHLQTFRLDQASSIARAIRVDIESNHGSRTHTCLYRVRVHGKPATGTGPLVAERQRL